MLQSLATGGKRCQKKYGTKLHTATDRNGMPLSVTADPANEHDATRFADGIHDFLDVEMAAQTESAYADRGYDSESIRRCLENNIVARIPHREFGRPGQSEKIMPASTRYAMS